MKKRTVSKAKRRQERRQGELVAAADLLVSEIMKEMEGPDALAVFTGGLPRHGLMAQLIRRCAENHADLKGDLWSKMERVSLELAERPLYFNDSGSVSKEEADRLFAVLKSELAKKGIRVRTVIRREGVRLGRGAGLGKILVCRR